jgi:hypothetical protein
MDIISAHRDGLIEQLDEEVAALAGRRGDHAQRAVVLHHLYDHSRGSHLWALSEARRELRIAGGLAALRRRIARWSWFPRDRGAATEALNHLSEILGEMARLRTMAAYRAYRISSTPALRDAAAAMVEPSLLALFDEFHAARRAGTALSPEAQQMLAEASERVAAGAVDQDVLDRAWAAVGATGLKWAAKRVLGEKALARRAAKDERRGAARVEQLLRASPALPASFRANPAQHFYALQRMLLERRRQRWREACDREPDAFELAA